MTRMELQKLRNLIVKAAKSLADEDAMEAPVLFDAWAVGVSYVAGDRIDYEGVLYKVNQAHTSQEDWLPSETPALYSPVAKPGEIPVWVQPTGAQDAYMMGDLVHYPTEEDPVYESTVDNNVWSPDVYGWVLHE